MIPYSCDTKFIVSLERVCVFTLVKTQARISHTLWGNEELCVAAMGLCVFQCVASATHFLILAERRKQKYGYAF